MVMALVNRLHVWRSDRRARATSGHETEPMLLGRFCEWLMNLKARQ